MSSIEPLGAPLNVFHQPLRRNSSLHSLHSLAEQGEPQGYLMSSIEPLGAPLDVSLLSSRRRNSSLLSLPSLAEKGESQRNLMNEPDVERPKSASRPANPPSRRATALTEEGANRSRNASMDQLKPLSVRKSNANGTERRSSLRKAASKVILTQSLRRRKKKQKLESNPTSGPPSLSFLETHKKVDEGSILPNTKWWHGFFIFSVVSLLACIITLWAPYPYGARMPTEMVADTPWSDGCKNGLSSCICPSETVCADDMVAMILLTISRCSAWFDYPLYMVLFLSKCNNLNNYLQKTVLRCFINFSDYHKVHRLFGIIVGIESASHSGFHVLRWARREDDMRLLFTSKTGVTGLVALVCGAVIILPMTHMRTSMSFELRKGLHYLAVVWAVGLMYHAPERMFWLIGLPLFFYLVDKVVEIFFRTFLIESAAFERLSDSLCVVTFENPPGFGRQNSAYVYLMLPWLSRYQFHVFTVFPSDKPNHSSICISKCGDWTESLIQEITIPTHRPAFVMGPFLSPFSSPAMDSENLVAVASGIGVTPVLSLLKKYAVTTRRLNLIWICRDAALVKHFLQSITFGTDGHILIYYTGKRSLFLNDDDLPPKVSILKGRPDVEKTISAVIYSIANDEELPADLGIRNSLVAKATPGQRVKLLLERALSTYSLDQLFEYSASLTAPHVKNSRPSDAEASIDGVSEMMENLLGQQFYGYRSKILNTLDIVDTFGDGMLNRDMFEDFVHLIRNDDFSDDGTASTSLMTDDKEGTSTWSGNYGVETILRSDGKYSADKWKMLYCGRSAAVVGQLKAYKRKYMIGLSVEKFDW